MPNTAPHILTAADAHAYREEVRTAADGPFTPLMTGFLTEQTDPKEVRKGFLDGTWVAMKVYPRAVHGHGTTNSAEGIDMWKLHEHPALPLMQELGMPLLMHPEVNMYRDGTVVDIYDRERLCIDIIKQLRDRFPELRISAEHGTSRELAEYIEHYGDPEYLVATVTCHHLMFDRNDLHTNGFQPHLMCYPILKRASARDAWRRLVSLGCEFISAGTDSAPHPTKAKESACGCAGGVFTAHAAVPLYAQIFDELSALKHLENFLCVSGPRFYRRDPKPGTMVLKKKPWTCDSMIPVEGIGDDVRPFGYHENENGRFKFEWRIISRKDAV